LIFNSVCEMTGPMQQEGTPWAKPKLREVPSEFQWPPPSDKPKLGANHRPGKGGAAKSSYSALAPITPHIRITSRSTNPLRIRC
jgi:hypothetical protein